MKKTIKKTGLAGALAARKELNQPEPEPQAEPQAETKKQATPRRFHTTLYPDPELYRDIRITLLRQNEGKDFNQLVNELLAAWYAEHGDA